MLFAVLQTWHHWFSYPVYIQLCCLPSSRPDIIDSAILCIYSCVVCHPPDLTSLTRLSCVYTAVLFAILQTWHHWLSYPVYIQLCCLPSSRPDIIDSAILCIYSCVVCRPPDLTSLTQLSCVYTAVLFAILQTWHHWLGYPASRSSGSAHLHPASRWQVPRDDPQG